MALLQITVHNRGRVPVHAEPKNGAGDPALLDGRTGRTITAAQTSGDGSAEADPGDPGRLFFKPAAVDLAIGDPPRVSMFDVKGDRDLSVGEDFLVDQVELTHVAPDAPPPAETLGLTAEAEEPAPA